METLTTAGIKISVLPHYLPEESAPVNQQYMYAYRIIIENLGTETVQLLRRHWFILESNGVRREVEGEGVVGEQPVIGPGERFHYSSWCPMMTDMGKMFGTYQMKRLADGRGFMVKIPPFKLVPPFKMN